MHPCKGRLFYSNGKGRLGRRFNTTYYHSHSSSSNSLARPNLPPTLPSYDTLSLASKFWILAPRAILAAGWVYFVREYCFDITQCEGPSMYPTLEPFGEIILLEKFWCRALVGGTTGRSRIRWAQQQQGKDQPVWWEPKVSVTQLHRYQPLSWWGKIQHFVSALSVGDLVATWHPHRPGMICKRILGLPGDQVLLSPDQTAKFNLPPHQRLLVIPDGYLWLEGDNPLNSSDSRDYGPVPTELVIGRVLLRLWPIRGRAWFRRGEPPAVPHAYGAESTVLPAGYQGQTIVRDIQPSA